MALSSVGLAASTMCLEPSSGRRYLSDQHASELPPQVLQLLSFGDDSLLRAARLTGLLSRGASIFRDPQGSAASYDLSSPTTTIDYFLSHNWVVSRRHKFVALAVCFNHRLAVAATLAVSACLAALMLLDALPALHADDGQVTGAWGQILCVPVYVVVLFISRDVLQVFGHQGPSVFLDKVCIHQTDAVLQKKGIEKLGAFLNHSNHMAVIYTDIYITKLWTIFEIAAFLCLHPTSRLMILSVQKAFLFLSVILIFYLSSVGFLVTWLKGGMLFSVLFIGAPATIFYFICRRMFRQKMKTFEAIENFSVRDCTCAVEEDRAVVYGNITRLLQGCGLASENCTEEEALSAFDDLVRSRESGLLGKLIECFGTTNFNYGDYVWMACALSGGALADQAAKVAHGVEGFTVVVEVAFQCCLIFGVWPWMSITCELAASKQIHLVGWRDSLYFVLSSHLMVPVLWAMFGLFAMMKDTATGTGSIAWLAGMSLLGILAAGSAYRVSRRHPSTSAPRTPRRSGAEVPSEAPEPDEGFGAAAAEVLPAQEDPLGIGEDVVCQPVCTARV